LRMQNVPPKVPWFKKRKCVSVVCRMRSGHCLIPKHIGITDFPDCSCGVEGDLDHIFVGCESQAVKSFPTPLRMAEILRKPQHPAFRKIYRFLEDEHLIGVLADGLCWFCMAVVLSVLACTC